MPSFRLPWKPSKALSQSDDPDRSLLAKEATDLAKDSSALAKPTAVEYAGEAARQFLAVLFAVAEQIPVPGVATAVKIAKNIIDACDQQHAASESAEDLKLRIKNLVTIMVGELKEKQVDQIPEKLQQNIESLSNDLEYIQQKLIGIASQNRLLLVIFRGLNEEKIKKCVGHLDNALENFSFVCKINDAILLQTLEKEILTFHASHQKTLDNIKGKVDHIHVTIDNVKAILEEHCDQLIPSSSSRPRLYAAIPANAGIFHGRKALVAQLVHILTSTSNSQKQPHICLLGPGGMGKTSIALAVMAHPEMQKYFPEQNQIWVPCVKATSVSLLLDTLYSSLGMTWNTGNTLNDIISEIKLSAEPLVLLLDNFETPWNVVESWSETEQILHEIDQIAHVTIFITMRSSIPPCNGKQWQSFNIEPVDEIAAHQIYLDICSTGRNDPNLATLLHSLGHMPLAITLMANRAKMFGLEAGKLIEEYKRIGTAMLGQAQEGVDAKHSLDVCISLSTESPSMKKSPDAYKLLATLAMLPVGTTYDGLVKWWAHALPNLMDVLQVLVETSLIQRQETNYFVLPVIRSYILDASRFPSNVQTTMITSACNFLIQHHSFPGDLFFKKHSDALSIEEGNLQAIFLNATKPEPGLIIAFLVLAQHQLSTRPRLEVIEHALKLAHQIEGHKILLTDVLICYGRILTNLDHYDLAVKQFNLAYQIFLSISNEQQAAQCLLELVEIYNTVSGIAFQKKLQLVADAKSVFEKLHDAQGVALSLYTLGTTHGQHGFYTDSIKFLTHAREMFQNIGNVQNQANCSYHLGLAHYWAKRYDAALTLETIAVQEYENIGQYPGDPMLILGTILFMKGRYPDALEMLVQTLRICKSYGRPMDIAQTLETIGRTWAKMGWIANAKCAYMEAMQYYGTTQARMGKLGITSCQFLIQQAENPDLVPTSEERNALSSYSDF